MTAPPSEAAVQGPAILLVEDDRAWRQTLARHLARKGARVHAAATCGESMELLARHAVDLVLTDVNLPDGRGFEVLRRAAQQAPPPVTLVMTGDRCVDHAVLAVQLRVADFLLKPFALDELDGAIERVLPQRARLRRGRRASLPSTAALLPRLIGTDPKLAHICELVHRVAPTDCSVLIVGDSGTGKELVARAIRDGSRRATKPFVVVNCAALPAALVESELFGHVRGAFTDAGTERPGLVASAHQGTLFLDEIGELPITLQAKLLRLLQEREVTPVGSSRSVRVDVRVISATNRDLGAMVKAGTFRRDLYYRLNVVPIALPLLRERRGDIPALVQHFVARVNLRRGRRVTGVAPDALEALCAYDWPGNVRELENLVARIVLLRGSGEIAFEDLPLRVRGLRTDAQPPRAQVAPRAIDVRGVLARYEAALVRQALERARGSKLAASKLLGLSRTALLERIRKLDLPLY
ncbi:MAG: sigma-54-dependent Fis family transcriptional regulator [Myxococcales bacterium]|nr:sigma-54-dependent Fis family transcriptional regulator [Myxococcales bacterium]